MGMGLNYWEGLNEGEGVNWEGKGFGGGVVVIGSNVEPLGAEL